MSRTHNETVEIVKTCFQLPNNAEEISNLVIEYEAIRWNAFHGVIAAIKRVSEIDDRFKELGLE